MKYVVFLGDGMADSPNDYFGGKTPLEIARKPNIDALAAQSVCGMVKTVPDGMPAGSDTANLSVMGYDVRQCYTGRSPIEAASMGIQLEDTDVTMRCNLVTLSEDEPYGQKTMTDYSSDEITSEEAAQLVETLNEKLVQGDLHLYAGKSYRHCMVWKNGDAGLLFTPPHDILGKKISRYLRHDPKEKRFTDIMERSSEILKNHPVNLDRVSRGLRPANSMWLWGEGTKLRLEDFRKLYGVNGAVISAVDLIKGIGVCAGLKTPDVEGATGTITTNYEGKARAAIDALNGDCDYVYIHVEAPDECGHRQEYDNKVRSIELIDEKIVGPVTAALRASGEDFRILVLPDHPTPLSVRTHTADPVPFLIYDSTEKNTGVSSYTEAMCAAAGLFIGEGCSLMGRFIKKQKN